MSEERHENMFKKMHFTKMNQLMRYRFSFLM